MSDCDSQSSGPILSVSWRIIFDTRRDRIDRSTLRLDAYIYCIPVCSTCMKRRDLLAGAAVGCVGGISGCVSTDSLPLGDESTETRSSPTGNETENESETDGGVEVALETPDEAAVGETFAVEFVADNAGDSDTTVSAEMRITVPGRDTEVVEVELEVSAGSTESEEVSVTPIALGSVVVTVEEYDLRGRTDIGPLELGFGEYVEADGLPAITVLSPEISRTYRYGDSGGTRQVEASSGNQFVFAVLRARNPGSETTVYPTFDSFEARVGGHPYEPTRTEVSGSQEFVDPVVGKELDVYSPPSNPVDEGDTPRYESRIVPFEVRSEELSGDIEIHVRWSLGQSDGDTAIRWTRQT